MYIKKVKIQYVKGGDWESGYYIADHENSANSIILTDNFKPIDKKGTVFQIWDYKTDIDNRFEIIINN